ncbi:glycosyltransferase family 1 protein [Aquincola sp. S2]|uniref:Glycosyltransferase family 1 protein n=2 Tax=Pseudaquabacterium terrae TaxID=2732868 RepID=A0ABX2EJW8_9BURK|nr:glycosyltransferase family 1 protein [Aquabacterium terrae]NRF68909.1 glycosyltransferase family 1 protein [Aquabacterium terrae]
MREATDPIVVEDLAPTRRSLRIAVVTETYPPEVNGVAMTLARVVEGLRSRDHAIQLVRPRQREEAGADAADDGLDEVLMRGLPIPRYPHLTLGMPSKKALLARWTVKRPDIVHIATEGPLGWSALQAALQLKLPVSSDFRTNFHAYSRHYGVGWLHKPILAYLRKFHNRTRYTMVPTEALREQLVDAGFRNLRVLARGVDTTLFDPRRRSDTLRASWGATERTRVMLCVGRLAAEKNLGLLLTAFEAIRQAERDVKLVLVGDGPERAALQRRCPDAVFAGARSGEDLAAHYASADVFLFPSLTETFGNVTVEAMASGLAVLAFHYAAAERFIEPGENGLTARFDDEADFVRQAVQLAGDRTLCRAIAQRARTTATQHGWEHIVEQIERVLCSAIDQPAG